jgi:anti-sigma factor RsiW
MTCRRLRSDVIDFARGVSLPPGRQEALAAHLRACATCAALAERQRAMSVALRRLASDQQVPQAGDRGLEKLLASFNAHPAHPSRVRAGVELALAASVLIVAGLSVGWHSVSAPVPTPDVVSPAASGDAPFVILAGANALPRFESGQVIRVEIPSPEGVITADVLVGQDGLARAVRLVQ